MPTTDTSIEVSIGHSSAHLDLKPTEDQLGDLDTALQDLAFHLGARAFLRAAARALYGHGDGYLNLLDDIDETQNPKAAKAVVRTADGIMRVASKVDTMVDKLPVDEDPAAVAEAK